MENLNNELNFIQDKDIKEVTEQLLSKVPTYFWTVPASSSGKYHPAYTLGEGGLVRHTKAAVKIAVELSEMENFTQKDIDFAIAALILHDSHKQGDGKEGHTIFSHPLVASHFVANNAPEWYSTIVSPLIASHMGKWTTSTYEPETILPAPLAPLQKFVHLCDYLASRKCITVEL